MAAPKGNQFWKIRSKHGRDAIFDNPDLMWESACEYFDWCDKHPWIKKDVTKKQVLNTNQQTFEVEKETLTDTKQGYTQRPFTLSGLCIYMGTNTKYFFDFKLSKTYIDKGFSEVINTIEEIIYTNKFEGATVGAFNANIIARDLGLSEKTNTDITTNGKSIIQEVDYSKLSDEALREISSQYEKRD